MVTTAQIPASELAASLGPQQYGEPVTVAEEPIPAAAWIHTRNGHQLVDAVAVAWTPRAVQIRYADQLGRVGQAWVWAKAVTRR